MMTSALHVRTLQNIFKYSNQLVNKSLRISIVLVSKLEKCALHSSPIVPQSQSRQKHSGMSNNPFSGEGEPPMKKADCCFTMDISKSPIFQKIFNDELVELKRICDENEMEIRLAGGCGSDRSHTNFVSYVVAWINFIVIVAWHNDQASQGMA